MKKKEQVTQQTLEDIRQAVREIDVKRRDASLTPGQREVLELSASALRDAERVAEIVLEKKVIDELGDTVKELKSRSSAIRARVTAMGKVPKALDSIESVISIAVSVLKNISKWSFVLVFFVLHTVSCSVLTKSQVKMVNALAVRSDSLTCTPAVIFTNLAEVREGRGLLYAAGMSSPEAHFNEVKSLYGSTVKGSSLINKAESYVKALNSYCRALRSLASTNRWSQYGVELRGIGRRADSVLIAVNGTGWLEDDITTGFAKLSGRYASLLAEGYMKCRQARAIKEYVTEGDTLVAECVSRLVEILKSDELKGLVEYEQTALDDDYRAFLDAASLSGNMMELSLAGDRAYMKYAGLLTSAGYVRTRCITALRTFSSAHSKLALNLRQRSAVSENELAADIYEDIEELNAITSGIVQLTEK